jgi:hypothetical protein
MLSVGSRTSSATPRWGLVVPFLVTELQLGPGVGDVAVGQHILAGVVLGPGQLLFVGHQRHSGGDGTGIGRCQPALREQRCTLGRRQLWAVRGYDGRTQVL